MSQENKWDIYYIYAATSLYAYAGLVLNYNPAWPSVKIAFQRLVLRQAPCHAK